MSLALLITFESETDTLPKLLHSKLLMWTLPFLMAKNCCCYRDGMIKRPGNERYLSKVTAEGRKAYSEVLEIASQTSQTDSEVDDNHSD